MIANDDYYTTQKTGLRELGHLSLEVRRVWLLLRRWVFWVYAYDVFDEVKLFLMRVKLNAWSINKNTPFMILVSIKFIVHSRLEACRIQWHQTSNQFIVHLITVIYSLQGCTQLEPSYPSRPNQSSSLPLYLFTTATALLQVKVICDRERKSLNLKSLWPWRELQVFRAKLLVVGGVGHRSYLVIELSRANNTLKKSQQQPTTQQQDFLLIINNP
jgi:hypothetical protein